MGLRGAPGGRQGRGGFPGVGAPRADGRGCFVVTVAAAAVAHRSSAAVRTVSMLRVYYMPMYYYHWGPGCPERSTPPLQVSARVGARVRTCMDRHENFHRGPEGGHAIGQLRPQCAGQPFSAPGTLASEVECRVFRR